MPADRRDVDRRDDRPLLALILPLMVSSFIATFVADATGSPPVYDGLLESQLKE